jgi:hypothetical protein
MTTLIIITIYILSIFLNRYLNKKALKYGAEKIWLLWFVPIIPAIVLFLGIILQKYNSNNWFTGKYW